MHFPTQLRPVDGRSASQLEDKPQRLQTIVIDDSPEFLSVVCALLDRNDDVDLVAHGKDGIDAIELVAKLRPDLVLMDIDMPRVSGLQAAKIISARFPATQVVLMSGTELPDLAVAALVSGAIAFIRKTRLRQDLAKALQNCAVS